MYHVIEHSVLGLSASAAFLAFLLMSRVIFDWDPAVPKMTFRGYPASDMRRLVWGLWSFGVMVFMVLFSVVHADNGVTNTVVTYTHMGVALIAINLALVFSNYTFMHRHLGPPWAYWWLLLTPLCFVGVSLRGV